ncbi:MAG: hypothetical protein KUG77_22020 [Nannocystaceae bacterium]|nr:hypothetical protein [Nannocystaceae bacterium]
MRRLALTFGMLTTLGLPACDLEPAQEVTLRVDHFREPCPDGQSGYCLRVVQSDPPGITHARNIAGFEHRWGTSYELRALVAPAAGGIPSFDLVEVVTEDTVDETARFQIDLPPEFVERVDSSTFELVGETRARCATPEVCDAVVDALYEDTLVSLELSHDPAGAGSFIAHAAALRRE